MIHDTQLCIEGPNGSQCDQCAWAEFEQAEDARITKSQQAIALPPRVVYLRCGECGQPEPCGCGPRPSAFDADWNAAPYARTRLTEREHAEYFWRLGRRQGVAEAVRREHDDMVEMARLMDISGLILPDNK